LEYRQRPHPDGFKSGCGLIVLSNDKKLTGSLTPVFPYQNFVTCEVDRDTVPSQHRCGGGVGFAQQTKEEVLRTDVVVRQEVVRAQSPLRTLRFRSRVLEYALALAAPWDVHRLWDQWLWFGHFLFQRFASNQHG